MKSLWKYIVGFFTFVVGILVLSGKKNKKVKELNNKIKDVKQELKDKEKQGDALKATLESKKEALEQIKSKKYKKKKINKKDTEDFLKKFSKKKK